MALDHLTHGGAAPQPTGPTRQPVFAGTALLIILAGSLAGWELLILVGLALLKLTGD